MALEEKVWELHNYVRTIDGIVHAFNMSGVQCKEESGEILSVRGGSLKWIFGGGCYEERRHDANQLDNAGMYPYIEEAMDRQFRGKNIAISSKVGCAIAFTTLAKNC